MYILGKIDKEIKTGLIFFKLVLFIKKSIDIKFKTQYEARIKTYHIVY